jgi:YVTN family beta-propeller protein
VAAAIRTPDQRLRVFVSSTLGELADERAAVRAAIERLRLTPVMFELGARPHPPRDLYCSYIEQSDVFVGIYGETYGWVAPEHEISGLEDEYDLSQGKPTLLYVKEPAPHRDGRLVELIRRIEAEGRVSYKTFSTAAELGEQLSDDLAVLLTERFAQAAELPSGTVTMLFTDIEGSTQLLRSLGKRYPDVLNEHRRLLGEAFARHDGHVIDTEGDSFFVAFRRASDAVAAAADAQRSLAAHVWPDGVEMRVRMGLHTGEPTRGGEGYVGLGVHRTARIAAAGHGGQVLVSETTRQLLEGEESPGVELRDLGLQVLKDFEEPQRLYQLVAGGLPNEFPPLRTLAAQEQTELAFVGREAELAEAAREAIEREVKRRTRRHVAVGAAAALVAAGAAVGVVLALSGGKAAIAVAANAVGAIDPKSNKIVASIPVGTRPGDITYGSGSLWVANLDDRTVSRIDPKALQLERTVSVSHSPNGLAAGYGAVWIGSSDGNVSRIDPAFNVVRSVVPGNRSFVLGGLTVPSSIAVGEGAVWFANASLSKLDPATSRLSGPADTGYTPAAIAVGAGAVWVADNALNTVTRVDPRDLSTETIHVGNAPSGMAVGDGGVWVADAQDDAVVRIDPATGGPLASIPVGGGPAGIAVGPGAVWVANTRSGTVSRIDPGTNRVVATIKLGNSPTGITIAGGRVWVTVQKSAAAALAVNGKGGVAHVVIGSDASLFNLDPAEANSDEAWQLSYATCAKLLDYPDAPAPRGRQLVAEVAAALPRVSDGGRSYTFRIRPGFRFSPPSNQPVTAQTFKDAIERSLSRPNRNSPQARFMHDVVGLQAFQSGAASHISGVATNGDMLTIRLTQPSGSLLARLATPYFCAVPSLTPASAQGVPGIPSAGPYYVAFYSPGQRVVLARNPNYHGPRPRHLAAIDYTIGSNAAKNMRDVESGRIDYALKSFVSAGIPEANVGELRARYGPHGSDRSAGSPKLLERPDTTLNALFINATRPLFRSANLRRAVAYAIDREALVADFARGFGDAAPIDQYLAPSYPGFPGRPIYPLRPDLQRARALARGHGGVAIMYAFPGGESTEAIITQDLAAIGIDVVVKHYPVDDLLARERRPGEPYDLFLGGYAGTFADPADTFDPSVENAGVLAANRFRDSTVDRLRAAAERLQGQARIRAYTRLDIQLARDVVPAVVFAIGLVPDFLSSRMGCEVSQPIYGLDLAALCVRG